MADADLMPARGVPFRAQVGPTGIALNGTATTEQLAQRGMRPVCVVDNAGLNAGVTVEQLAQRGIRAACLVDENGLASGVTADELRRRSIRPLVSLTSAGLSGSTTMLQLAQRGLDYACLVNESGTASGGGASAEATAFLARTSGLDATHTTAYTNLINGLVTDGVWAKLDFLYVYATQNSATALLNLVSATYSGTALNSPTFTADRGYTGVESSTTIFVNTGFNPATASSPKYTQNSAHYSVWSLTNVTANFAAMGNTVSGTTESVIYPRFSSGLAYFRINDSGSLGGIATGDALGHYIANRANGSNSEGYKNGAILFPSASAPATAVANQTFYVCGYHINNGAAVGASNQVAMSSAGASLTSGEALAFYNRLRTYMTAVGVP